MATYLATGYAGSIASKVSEFLLADGHIPSPGCRPAEGAYDVCPVAVRHIPKGDCRSGGRRDAPFGRRTQPGKRGEPFDAAPITLLWTGRAGLGGSEYVTGAERVQTAIDVPGQAIGIESVEGQLQLAAWPLCGKMRARAGRNPSMANHGAWVRGQCSTSVPKDIFHVRGS